MIHPSDDRIEHRLCNRLIVLLVCGGALLLLGGCAAPSLPFGDSGSHSDTATGLLSKPDRIMLDDLSRVVVQIFPALSTTVQVNKDDTDPRMQYFVNSLSKAGFGIQRVNADQGANFLSYARKPIDKNNDTQLSVAIGAVIVERSYELLNNGKISPTSTMRLSGTRVPVEIEDITTDVFQARDSSLSKAQYIAALNLDEQAPIISLITPDVVNRVTNSSVKGPSLQGLNSSKVEVNNLFYGNGSTFASILDDYVRVDRQIIVFGNDSMVLGETNKLLIDQFVESKLKNDDVISLVGCSNGPTTLEIGNEGLALGRAQRVTEALMERGVARHRILDEGCWAPTDISDRFPGRGVVLEIWRNKT